MAKTMIVVASAVMLASWEGEARAAREVGWEDPTCMDDEDGSACLPPFGDNPDATPLDIGEGGGVGPGGPDYEVDDRQPENRSCNELAELADQADLKIQQASWRLQSSINELAQLQTAAASEDLDARLAAARRGATSACDLASAAEAERLETVEPRCVERPTGVEVCFPPTVSEHELALRAQCSVASAEATRLEGLLTSSVAAIAKQTDLVRAYEEKVVNLETMLEELETLLEDKDC